MWINKCNILQSNLDFKGLMNTLLLCGHPTAIPVNIQFHHQLWFWYISVRWRRGGYWITRRRRWQNMDFRTTNNTVSLRVDHCQLVSGTHSISVLCLFLRRTLKCSSYNWEFAWEFFIICVVYYPVLSGCVWMTSDWNRQ